MDSFNAFIDAVDLDFPSLCSVLIRVLRRIKGDMLVVSTPFESKKVLSKFPEEMRIKVVHYQGTLSEKFYDFCQAFPSEWTLMILPNSNLSANPIEEYKKFWGGKLDCIFLPATSGSIDSSGNLMFMNYFVYRKWDRALSIEENFFELAKQGISFVGVNGVVKGSWIWNRTQAGSSEEKNGGREETSGSNTNLPG